MISTLLIGAVRIIAVYVIATVMADYDRWVVFPLWARVLVIIGLAAILGPAPQRKS